MHPLINAHRQEIAELARRYGVRRLEVFGSILRDDFDESSSDIDIVVEFEPRTGGGGFRQYFDLKAKLEALLAHPVDLIELGAMENTRLKRIIQRSKIPIYAAPT
jgi:predicted nucleotidyltransferase